MKRLLSILLTVAMLATMLSVPMVVGAKEYTAGNMTLKLGDFTNNGGLFGKGADEYAMSMKSDAPANGEAKALFSVTSSADYDFSDQKYIVLDLNVAPNGNATGIAVGPNAGLFSVSSSAFVKNRWNNVRIVVEEKTADEMQASGTYQPMTLYVNGVLVGEHASDLAGGDKDAVGTQAYGKGFRFSIKGSKNVVVGYVADVNLYTSDVNEAPDVAAIASGSNYTVEANQIISDGTAIVADLATDDATDTIVAYEDDTFGTILADDALLAPGNVIVTKTADGAYNAYDIVSENVNTLYYANDGTLPSALKANVTTVSGIGGKSKEDKSAFVESDAAQAYDGNIMINLSNFYTKSKKYLVMEANMNPVDAEYDMKGVSVHTNGHAVVAAAHELNIGEWNKYLMYVDFEANKTYVYVNGELVGENAPAAAVSADKATLRFCFNGVMEGEVPNRVAYPLSLYVDDMTWYETDTAPDGVALTAKPELAPSDKYILTEGKIFAQATTTVADIKALNKGAKVYKNISMDAYADDSELIGLGMVIVLEGANKAISSYPVTVDYSETELDLRTGDDKYPFPSVGNGVVETVAGIGGKDESDKVQSITVTSSGNGDTFLSLKSWGNVVKTGADNSVTPTWDKSDYNGYLVIEFSIFNIDNTNVSVVTTQSTGVSANVANYLPQNRWSRVKVVYNALDGDENEGKAITYVDGVQAGGWTTSGFGKMAGYATNNYMRNDIRLSIKGGTKDQISSYVDDIRVYETPVLRAQEFIDFVAPANSSVVGDELNIVKAVPVTVGEVKDANPTLPVKVFNNGTEYAEITDDGMEIVPGNIIYVAKQSEMAAEAGIDYKDLYKVLLVAETSSTKDVITGFPTSVTRGSVADAEGNVYGRVSDTMKVVTGPTGDSNWYTQHNYKTPGTNMNYLVVETDIAPSADVTSLFLGTNGHAHISQSVYVGEGSDIAPEKWSKVALVYNIAEEVCDVYVNGKLVSKGVANSFAAMQNCLRFVVYSEGSTDCYIDNYKIYESAVYPAVDAPAAFETGYAPVLGAFVDNKSGVISIPAGIDADIEIEGYDITVYDSEYNVVSGEVSDGNIVFIQKDGSYAYYTIDILEDNDIVVIGDTYDANNDIMTVGDIAVYGVTDEEAKLVVAQYDDEGNMIKTAVSESGSGVLKVEFTSEELDDSKVKAFLFKNGQLKPLCKNEEITHSMVYNILMLGNSFSMDVTYYMEDVATAQGKDFNVHVLNKGGSSVNYHYENREVALEKSGLNLFKSGVHVGKSNLKILLETYDYDYVIMQNWGADVAFYENTDANYEANWAVFADLAKYINEREPEAEIMLHETWPFEAGYNSWTNAAVRDEAGANIRAIYDRCAADIKAELGLDYDVRKISSLDAFEAARAYENAEGVKMFDTTYDGSKHEFAGTEVAVGDGSMLLGDEDAAAGKVSLYRDGFHASAAARYLIALNAVQFITGKSVNGNTFRPGSIRLDSAGRYMDTGADMSMSSGTVYQTYDPLSEDVVTTLQTIAESIR